MTVGSPSNADRKRLVVFFPEETPPSVDLVIYKGTDRITWKDPRELPSEMPKVAPDSHDPSTDTGPALLDFIAPAETEQRDTWMTALDRDDVDAVTDVLFDIRNPELHTVPWELITDPPWNFQSPTRPAVRVLHRGEGLPPAYAAAASTVPLLRVLVVFTGSMTENEQDDALGAIHRGLRVAPCIWRVDVLHVPTEDEFLRHLANTPQILHIVGHGDVQADHQKIRLTPPGRGAGWSIDETFVEKMIIEQGRRLPDFVTLAACTNPEVVNDLDHAIVRSGSAAVVSMRGNMEMTAANRFTEQFYRSLARRRPVHVAAAHARHFIRVDGDDQPQPTHWPRPVLTVGFDPVTISLSMPPGNPGELLDIKSKVRPFLFDDLHLLTDQSDIRGRIIEYMTGPWPVLVVTGEDQCGKSAVVQACVVAAWAAGSAVLYVHLPESTEQRRAEDVLEQALSAAKLWLEPDHFEAGQQQSTGTDLMATISTESQPISAYGSFVEQLKGWGDHKSLLLVIDGASRIHDLSKFRDEFVEPIRRGTGTARLMLVGARDPELIGGKVLPQVANIAIPAIDRRNALELVSERVAKGWPKSLPRQDEGSWEKYKAAFMEWGKLERKKPGELTITQLVKMDNTCRSEAKIPPPGLFEW